MFGYANPKRFQSLSGPAMIVSGMISLILFVWGFYLALFDSPPDYLQSESVRIMYIHVPAAWMAMMAYASLGVSGILFLVWKHMLAGLYIRAMAPAGAAFTAICLITGSIWGQPTWGTWWVWDARLTSVLVLFFLYIGIIAIGNAFENKDRGLNAAAWLSIIGLVNLPVIKFSVDWWNTLHQPSSISSLSRIANPSIAPGMLMPLLVMAGAYLFLFIALSVLRLDNEIRARRIEIMMIRKVNHA